MNASAPIRRNARLAPDAPAYVRSDGTVITYATLERTVDALARRLRARSLAPGHIAAVRTDNELRYLCVALSLARIGAAIAPTSLPAGMATVTIADAALCDGVQDPLAFSEVWPTDVDANRALPPGPIHEGDSAVFAYCPSSGTTTDTPKLVALSHDIVRRRVVARAMSAPAIAGTRHVCMVGPDRIFGLARCLRALWTGCVVVEPNLHAEALPGWLAQSGVTFMSVSPIGLHKILQCLPDEGVRSALAMIEVSGGRLPEAIYELALQRLHRPQIVTSYGSTETGPVASAPVSVLAGRAGAVGFAVPGVEIETVDADGRTLPTGAEGMLRVRSPHAATGYVGDDARSSLTFRDGWVYPNDNAIVDADGALRIMGRTDDVVNINGVKINPQSIEDVLHTLADLREVAVFGVPEPTGMVALCAAIVPNQALDMGAFHTQCRARLGGQSPAFTIPLRALPRNAMGKVLRGELARIALEAIDRDRTKRSHR